MLFLYRPPQTYMPYSLPRNRTQQAAYNRSLQDKVNATRRVPASEPPDPIGQLKELAALHEQGQLDDDEFRLAKAKVLGTEEGAR
jgi:hypothetical protein